MRSRDFCYWLQGFFELTRTNNDKLELTQNHVDCIEKHLKMVFAYEIDPTYKGSTESLLDAIHGDGRRPTSLMKC